MADNNDTTDEGKADTRAVFEELRRLRSRYATGMGESNEEENR
jgi:hypothetical protein